MPLTVSSCPKTPVADVISTLVILPYIIFLLYDLKSFVILVSCTAVVLLIQKLSNVNRPPFRRPQGACACDVLNMTGDYSDKGGFPSGHVVALTSAFVLVFFKWIPRTHTAIGLLCSFVALITMSWARMEKKCHDSSQVMGGVVFGLLFTLVFM